MYREMAALSLAIAADAFFGADVDADSKSLFEAFQVIFDEYITMAARGFLVPSWFPTPGNLRFRRAAASLHQVVERIIAVRKDVVSPPWARSWDLLDMLLAAQCKNPDITDQQIHDEVATFLIGGHETTAIALAWTWYLLGQHPEAERKLAREARHVLGGRAPTFNHVSRLNYAEKVVKESMRLYPPVWFLTRKASEDLELGGYRVRKGTTLVMSMWAMHRDPRFYPGPETFNPERWSSDFADRLPKFAYMPFGAGPRRCIGSRFAMMEATMIIAAVSQAFRLDLIPGLQVTPVAATGLRPSSGVNVVLRERCWHGSTQPSFHQGVETVGKETRP
jgi:cytochrome P450